MKRWSSLSMALGLVALLASLVLWLWLARQAAPPQAAGAAAQPAADPARTAWNQAAALYREQRFAEAAGLYRAAAETAAAPRAAQATYNQGNCELRQACDGTDEPDARLLAGALERYRASLKRAQAAGGSLAEDARHNLELAKLLLARQAEQTAAPPTPAAAPEPPNPLPTSLLAQHDTGATPKDTDDLCPD